MGWHEVGMPSRGSDLQVRGAILVCIHMQLLQPLYLESTDHVSKLEGIQEAHSSHKRE